MGERLVTVLLQTTLKTKRISGEIQGNGKRKDSSYKIDFIEKKLQNQFRRRRVTKKTDTTKRGEYCSAKKTDHLTSGSFRQMSAVFRDGKHDE
jgi:hypothetical protein